MTKNIVGVNMFDSRSTAKRFIDILEAIVSGGGRKAGEDFKTRMVNLFWEKQVADEGVFEEYKITEQDLMEYVALTN